jgi:trigger factor
MNISKTNIDDLNAVVKLTIEKQDYEATVNETLKDYRKKANMPGFRKGMVPAGLIKKMYGKAVLAEEINKILSRELTKYIFDEKLDILGEPLPNTEEQKKIDFDKDENFEFVFDLGFSPAINIDFKKIGKLPYYEIVVDEQLITNQVEAYQNRFGQNIETEVIGEKEIAFGDFAQLDAEGNILADGIKTENAQVSISLITDEAVKELFLEKKVGDVVNFNPKTAFSNEHFVHTLLKISHEQLEELNAEFSFTINKINTFIPAELNEDLYQKIYGQETEITSVDALREKIAEELKANLKYSSEYRFMFDAKKIITDYVSMKLPVEFLKRWLVETNEKVTREQIDEEFDHFSKDLEWTLVKNKITKENELKVNEADITSMAREMAVMQFRQYGMFNVPEEYLDNYANSILKNEEEKHRMIEKKTEDKVLEFIKEKAEIEVKPVTQKEFDDLFEK